MKLSTQSKTPLDVLLWTSVGASIVWRYFHILVIHHASMYRFSDMKGYMDWAESLCEGIPENISHTVHSPGIVMFFHWIHCARHSWGDVEIALFLMSVGAIPLVWWLARQTVSRTAAKVSVIFSCWYPPFVGYAGLFMAEIPLLFLALLGSNFLVFAVRRSRQSEPDTLLLSPLEDDLGEVIESPTVSVTAFPFAIAAGLVFGAAAVIKPQALVVALLSFAALAFFRRKQFGLRLTLFGLLIGLSLPLALSANRCTQLSGGRFCLISNDAAHNMLFAFSPHLRIMHYKTPLWTFDFGNPSAVLSGETEEVYFDFDPWDQSKLFPIIRAGIAKDPAGVVRGCFKHLYQVFGGSPLWPISTWREPIFTSLGNLMFVAVLLVPFALSLLCAVFRKGIALPQESWALVIPLLTIVLVSFVCSGEARYRVPFDGYSIILGTHLWLELIGRFRSRAGSAEVDAE